MRAVVRALARFASLIYCSRCGTGNPLGTRFCTNCRALLNP